MGGPRIQAIFYRKWWVGNMENVTFKMIGRGTRTYEELCQLFSLHLILCWKYCCSIDILIAVGLTGPQRTRGQVVSLNCQQQQQQRQKITGKFRYCNGQCRQSRLCIGLTHRNVLDWLIKHGVSRNEMEVYRAFVSSG